MPRKETPKGTGKATGRGRSPRGTANTPQPAPGVAPVRSQRSTDTRPSLETPQPGMTTSPVPTHDQIEARARLIWEQRGRPQGQDIQIWTEAEQQLQYGRITRQKPGCEGTDREVSKGHPVQDFA